MISLIYSEKVSQRRNANTLKGTSILCALIYVNCAHSFVLILTFKSSFFQYISVIIMLKSMYISQLSHFFLGVLDRLL